MMTKTTSSHDTITPTAWCHSISPTPWLFQGTLSPAIMILSTLASSSLMKTWSHGSSIFWTPRADSRIPMNYSISKRAHNMNTIPAPITDPARMLPVHKESTYESENRYRKKMYIASQCVLHNSLSSTKKAITEAISSFDMCFPRKAAWEQEYFARVEKALLTLETAIEDAQNEYSEVYDYAYYIWHFHGCTDDEYRRNLREEAEAHRLEEIRGIFLSVVSPSVPDDDLPF